MNNLGSYKSVELVFIDELSYFAVTSSSGVYLRKSKDTQRLLPLRQSGASVDATPKNESSGTLYTHKAIISLLSAGVDKRLIAELEQVAARGSILIATTNNNEKRIFGNPNSPLFGTFAEIPGEKPSDFRHYELSISATCIHPALTLTE